MEFKSFKNIETGFRQIRFFGLWIVKIIQKYIFLLPIATQKQVFLLVHQLQLLKHPILSIYT